MTPNPHPNLVAQAALLFAGAFTGTTVGILLTRPAADSRAAAPPTTEALEGALAALAREVELLRREIPTLAEIQTARHEASSVQAAPTSPVPVRLPAASLTPEGTSPHAKTPTKEQVVETAADLHRRNAVSSVKEEHFLWTPAQILTRYGVPTFVYGGDSSETWTYEATPGKGGVMYAVHFRNGHVVDFTFSPP